MGNFCSAVEALKENNKIKKNGEGSVGLSKPTAKDPDRSGKADTPDLLTHNQGPTAKIGHPCVAIQSHNPLQVHRGTGSEFDHS